MSWQMIKLGDIVQVSKGKKHALATQETSMRYIQIDDLRNDENIKFTEDAKGTFVNSEDIVIAWDGANAGTIGYGLKGLIGSTLSRLTISDDNVQTEFLARFLQSRFSEIRSNCTGATIPHVSKQHLLMLAVPMPPLNEQKRIAAILDKADAIRRKRQQAIQLADDFLRSVFLDMFGDPDSNPNGFEVGTIRELVDTANYGTSGKASETDGEYPILRMGNITYEGSWDFSSLKYIDLTEKEKNKYLAYKGDLLFNRTNSKELVGKTAVFEEDDPMAIAGYLVRVRSNERGNNYYISGYLNSNHGKQTLRSMCKSIVGMANINAQELQDIKILLPPIELQNKFENIVKSTRYKLKRFADSQRLLTDSFNSISQRAFAGEL